MSVYITVDCKRKVDRYTKKGRRLVRRSEQWGGYRKTVSVEHLGTVARVDTQHVHKVYTSSSQTKIQPKEEKRA